MEEVQVVLLQVELMEVEQEDKVVLEEAQEVAEAVATSEAEAVMRVQLLEAEAVEVALDILLE